MVPAFSGFIDLKGHGNICPLLTASSSLLSFESPALGLGLDFRYRSLGSVLK